MRRTGGIHDLSGNKSPDQDKGVSLGYTHKPIDLSVVYQLGPARWVHDRFHENAHFLVEILFYGFVGPTIVFLAFNQIEQWLFEKEQAEQVARSTQLKLAAITEASADAIIGLNPDGRIESWIRGAELILGYYDDILESIAFSTLIGRKKTARLNRIGLRIPFKNLNLFKGMKGYSERQMATQPFRRSPLNLVGNFQCQAELTRSCSRWGQNDDSLIICLRE